MRGSVSRASEPGTPPPMNDPCPAPLRVPLYITSVDYPASRNAIAEAAIEMAAPAEVIETLLGLPDREYGDAAEVCAAARASRMSAPVGIGGAA